ncbi:Cupin domain [Slackia heliotrinireducens]|uniref:Uncharacterized conserved protein, contains double-stranded beta-helix domain n=1 Tax=Slackia heliotrinireducens (strain ATCC 29202 / DSM 20476 / NCTC 11029 / RHS 1) TaxID=471855 RepID=C7N2B6_SLAHD|nr:cupin domain-containing protein [Slackia heliotrinireducens]ACV21422.1 uncharacterized conserved protein, contains double-stranded beta-helix domain [Slackia heliotrinireducens DSM 20476]VEG98859.1 Cupin domain [Slackia heliotrinireducens]
MQIRNQGTDFTQHDRPDYCEQPFVFNHDNSYLAKFDEYTLDRPGYVAWFSHPAGPLQSGEMSDTVYYKGDTVSYHEHNHGIEVFLIDAGRVMVYMRGKKAEAAAGDIVFVPPFVSHGFDYLEDETVWREWFAHIRMNEGMLKERRLRTFGNVDLDDPSVKQKLARHKDHTKLTFVTEFDRVDKDQMPFIRSYDFAYDTFRFPGVEMLQKIARHELDGESEIWQYRMDKGFSMEWSKWNPHGVVLALFSGSMEVTVAGQEPFIVKAHDIVNIPSYLSCRIEALENNTVTFDYACKGLQFRALEHVRALQNEGSALLDDKEAVCELLEDTYDVYSYWKMH